MAKFSKNNETPTNGQTNPPYEGADGRAIGTRYIRCLHVDYERQPLDDDRDQEFHWRCPAVFNLPEHTLPYCPMHLKLYQSSAAGEQVTPEERSWAEETIDRYVETVTPGRPRKARLPEAEEALTDEDLERLRVYRDEQLTRARAAGLFESDTQTS